MVSDSDYLCLKTTFFAVGTTLSIKDIASFTFLKLGQELIIV